MTRIKNAFYDLVDLAAKWPPLAAALLSGALLLLGVNISLLWTVYTAAVGLVLWEVFSYFGWKINCWQEACRLKKLPFVLRVPTDSVQIILHSIGQDLDKEKVKRTAGLASILPALIAGYLLS